MNNILHKLQETCKDLDVLMLVGGGSIPTEALPDVVKNVMRANLVKVFSFNNGDIRLMGVEKSELTEHVAKMTDLPVVTTDKLPRLELRSNVIAFYYFDIQNADLFSESSEEDEVITLDVEHDRSKVCMPGLNLIPLMCGEMQIHSMDIPSGDPMELLYKMAQEVIRDIFKIRNVENIPEGFMEGIGQFHIIQPRQDSDDTYDVSFLSDEKIDEYTNLTLPQVFALYESRKAVTIQ